MKNVINVVAGLVLSNLSIGMASAADIEAGVVKSLPVVAEENPLKGKSLDASLIQLAPETISKADMLQQATSNLGPASGISHFEVAGVLSAKNNGQWEVLESWQSITNRDHGGAYLYVAVLQVGYGNNNNATMNGISRDTVLEERLCGSDLHVCNVGETITGWMYYYNYSGQESGYFTNSANSTAYPFGYWSDSISIR